MFENNITKTVPKVGNNVIKWGYLILFFIKKIEIKITIIPRNEKNSLVNLLKLNFFSKKNADNTPKKISQTLENVK